MKNTRKLIPAVVMLLVSAVLMSTASFAWFSMNQQVTATGMDVTATTPASLEITDDPSAGDWSYGVTLTKDVDGLNPVTRHTNDKWYVPASNNPIGTDGKAQYPLTDSNLSYWTEVEIDYETGKSGLLQYALTQDLYIRTNAGNTSVSGIKFAATATVSAGTDGASALMKSVKVYLVVNGIVTELNSTAKGEWIAPLSTATTNNIKVTVVVVYDGNALDGENVVVKNDNADLKETAVSVTFVAKNG
ncbi:MAG: hypothetical protein J6V09_01710 [Clostridia bacterium]|nr:hypothetical protein [Clostridia bacterium]